MLYKIIPYGDHILMASYADSKDAIKLSKLLKMTKKEQIKAVHYKKIKDFFCKVGVKIKIKDFHFCPFNYY